MGGAFERDRLRGIVLFGGGEDPFTPSRRFLDAALLWRVAKEEGPPLSIAPFHQINDIRRSGRATSSQMSAAAIASDPIATAPSISFNVVTSGKTIWSERM